MRFLRRELLGGLGLVAGLIQLALADFRFTPIIVTGFMARNAQGRTMTHLMPSPLFADSALTPGIQVADLFAYAIRLNEQEELYKTRDLKDPYFSAIRRYANIVKTKTLDYEDDDGVMQWGIRNMDASKFDYGPPSRKSAPEDHDNG